MSLFLGRELHAWGRAARKGLDAVSLLGRTRRVVARPGAFLMSYVLRTPYPAGRVELTNGDVIVLANRVDDLATIFVVLIRDDYGPIPNGAVVVDIGANIGTFALKAARDGASRVYSFEAHPQTAKALNETVAACRIQATVDVTCRAVTTRDGDALFMRAQSSPAAGVISERTKHDQVEVQTISFATIVARVREPVIDLVKLDCEGAEYAIILDSPLDSWTRVREVRLEYHFGRADELIARLSSAGFSLLHHETSMVGGDVSGTMRLAKR